MKQIVVAAVLLLTACSSGGDDINWSDYSPRVQERVEAAIEDADCVALQREFDAADANDHTDLMEYVDQAMRDAGCYD